MADLPVETSPNVIAVTAAVGGVILLFVLFFSVFKSKSTPDDSGMFKDKRGR